MDWPIRENALFKWQIAAAALLTFARISGAFAADNIKTPSPLHIGETRVRCLFEAVGGNPETLAYSYKDQTLTDSDNQSTRSPEDHPFLIYKGQSFEGLAARLAVTPDPFIFDGTKTNPGVRVEYFEPNSERPFSVTHIGSDGGGLVVSTTANSYSPSVYYLIIVTSDFNSKDPSITTKREMPDADFKSQLLWRGQIDNADRAAVQTVRERLLKITNLAFGCLAHK